MLGAVRTDTAWAALDQIHRELCRQAESTLPWESHDRSPFFSVETTVLQRISACCGSHPGNTDLGTLRETILACSEYMHTPPPLRALGEGERQNLLARHRAIIANFRERLSELYAANFRILIETQLVAGPNFHDATAAIIGIVRAEHTRTRQQIVKAINTRNIDGLDIIGPRTQECRDQVLAVVMWLANPKHPQNVHHACDRTFRPIRNGYDNKEKLYLWCHRNKSRIWAWVETYRLNHDID